MTIFFSCLLFHTECHASRRSYCASRLVRSIARRLPCAVDRRIVVVVVVIVVVVHYCIDAHHDDVDVHARHARARHMCRRQCSRGQCVFLTNYYVFVVAGAIETRTHICVTVLATRRTPPPRCQDVVKQARDLRSQLVAALAVASRASSSSSSASSSSSSSSAAAAAASIATTPSAKVSSDELPRLSDKTIRSLWLPVCI